MCKTKKYFLILLLFLLGIGCSTEKNASKDLNQVADVLNASTPIEMDEHTIFIKASVTNDNTFQYWYQVVNTSTPELLLEGVDKQIRSQIKEAFEIDKRLQVFVKHNTPIEYIYLNEDGETLTIIEIMPEDYK